LPSPPAAATQPVPRHPRSGRRQAPDHRLPVIRGREQLRRADAGRGAGNRAASNATLKVVDADSNPQTQYAQLQDAIHSGQYQGTIVQPIVGTGLISLIRRAIAKGLKAVNMDQIPGPDLSTGKPQVPVLSANVTFVPTEIGTKLGNLVVQACRSHSLSPCKAGDLYTIKGSALDVAITGRS
jgi:ribose transport system substrate-binding protein